MSNDFKTPGELIPAASEPTPPSDPGTLKEKNILKNEVLLPIHPLPPVKSEAGLFDQSSKLASNFSTPEMLKLDDSFFKLVVNLEQRYSLNYRRNRIIYWKRAKEILEPIMTSLPDPLMWSAMADVFYNEAEKKAHHPVYFEKILGMINEWGTFLSLHRKTPGYQAIKSPKGFQKQRLFEALLRARKPLSRASKPMTWPLLCRAKGKMTDPDHWNYMFILFVFGLRPSELDKIGVEGKAVYRVVAEDNVTILHVYQGKLGQLAAEKRWKQIPVEEPMQKQALELLEARKFKKPHQDVVRRVFPKRYGLYAPRKGFALHMVKRGWIFESASRYLGHSSVKTTEAYYVDRNKLRTTQILADVKERRERRGK